MTKKVVADHERVEALEHSKQVIEDLTNQNHRELIKNLLSAGVAALSAKDYLKSEHYATRILEVNPNEPHALTLKGLSYLSCRRPDLALSHFQKAKEIKPHSEVLHRYWTMAKQQVEAFRLEDNRWEAERRWRRVNVSFPILLGDFSTGWVQQRTVVSLSGGGALIEGIELPEDLHFSIDLPDASASGACEVIYSTKDRFTGIRFNRITAADQAIINSEVLKKYQMK